MFLGEYEHNLDDKGRLAIPSRFREELGEGVVITRGFDRCLMGFPRPIWEQLAQQVSGLSLGQGEARSVIAGPRGSDRRRRALRDRLDLDGVAIRLHLPKPRHLGGSRRGKDERRNRGRAHDQCCGVAMDRDRTNT